MSTTITVENIIKAPIEKVWEFWTAPAHIINWNFASDAWHTPEAVNDLRVNGKFSYKMEAKDGSFGFFFEGIYQEVIPNNYIEYTLLDGRKVKIYFILSGKETRVTETFETEESHTAEQQHDGWQQILNNFKRYVESSAN